MLYGFVECQTGVLCSVRRFVEDPGITGATNWYLSPSDPTPQTYSVRASLESIESEVLEWLSVRVSPQLQKLEQGFKPLRNTVCGLGFFRYEGSEGNTEAAFGYVWYTPE